MYKNIEFHNRFLTTTPFLQNTNTNCNVCLLVASLEQHVTYVMNNYWMLKCYCSLFADSGKQMHCCHYCTQTDIYKIRPLTLLVFVYSYSRLIFVQCPREWTLGLFFSMFLMLYNVRSPWPKNLGQTDRTYKSVLN